MTLLLISLNWFLYLLAVLLIVGVILYLVNNYLPVDAKLRQLINIVVVVGVIIYIIYLLFQLNP